MFKVFPRQKLIVALLAFIMLLTPAFSGHSHDGSASEENCVLCAFQTYDDADLRSSLAALSLDTSKCIFVRPIQISQSSAVIEAIARGPPLALIG